MATYAIGDLQGCRAEFELLLEAVGFGAEDHLWLVGDLVNRGPDSLGTLRRVMSLGEQCTTVLGNHDLHLLAIHYAGFAPGRSDTFDEILSQPDIEEIATWLRTRRLLHHDSVLGYVMTHAGIPHIWSLKKARALASEVERTLLGANPDIGYREFFAAMYGNEPACWSDDLCGMARLRCITNYLTRMRLVDAQGTLNFSHKGGLSDLPEGFFPWFSGPGARKRTARILFGHWAAIDGQTGTRRVTGLDTGCVWGRTLSALRLETGQITCVPAQKA